MNNNRLHYERLLSDLIAQFKGRIPLEELEEMQSCNLAGEHILALENICTQIYEYDLTVSKPILIMIRELANVYGVEKKYWEILNEERPTPQQE